MCGMQCSRDRRLTHLCRVRHVAGSSCGLRKACAIVVQSRVQNAGVQHPRDAAAAQSGKRALLHTAADL